MNYVDLRNIIKNKELIKDIENKTNFLDLFYNGKIPLRQRLFHIENDNFSLIKCKTCGNYGLKWSEKNKKYSTYCNSSCAQQDPQVREKTIQTCLSKFGETTNLKLQSTRQNIISTNIKKYGVANYSLTEEFKVKSKETFNKKYGVDNPSKLGVIKEKISQTHHLKYGRKRYSQIHIPEHIINLKNNVEEMKYLYYELELPITKIADILGVNHSQLCIHFRDNLKLDLRSSSNTSLAEKEISSYIKDLGFECILNDRTIIKPKELDIYIPDHNLAIELNGLAWHSELRNKDRFYHLNKTTLCKEKGVRLIHILDSEWKYKNKIVKSRLSSILGKNNRIYARKCVIKELSVKEYIDFFNNTHIQGAVGATVAYGLYYDNELVSAMSFGKSRYDHSFSWELLRFSNKLNTNTIGGASRLFKHFLKEKSPESIISYSDLRWNTGQLYLALGFKFVKNSGPNYWYTKDYRIIESRIKYQKHRLPLILENYDKNLTEWENMKANNFDRIWDCGNSVFHWKK